LWRTVNDYGASVQCHGGLQITSEIPRCLLGRCDIER